VKGVSRASQTFLLHFTLSFSFNFPTHFGALKYISEQKSCLYVYDLLSMAQR